MAGLGCITPNTEGVAGGPGVWAGLSGYLIGAMRAFESGFHEDAIRALERETGAKVTKVKKAIQI